MKISAASKSGTNLPDLIRETVQAVLTGLDGTRPNLGILFISSDFEDELVQTAHAIRDMTGVEILFGCVGESVIGPSREHESEPALSLWMGHFPDVSIHGFHLSPMDIEEAVLPGDWQGLLKISQESSPAFLLLADPYSTDINRILGAIDQTYPGSPVIGGMASSGSGPGQYTLFLQEEAFNEGAVGVSLSGNIFMETVVSQGCRPVGKPFVVTRSQLNRILEMGGMRPLDAVRMLYEEASEDEQILMQKGLFVGRVINEYQDSFSRGDFLIRNLVGVDEGTGTLAVMDQVPAGTTIQFHIRDAVTADEDLRDLLTSHKDNLTAGALLFTCNGRGTRLFPQSNHDLNVMKDVLGSIPVAGFFCAGELGPVGARNFIHGHTASIGLFRPSNGAA